jgi:hypothetical protein
MMQAADVLGTFPRPLSEYPVVEGAGLWDILHQRIALEPFNAVAAGIFFLAIFHTFLAARVTRFAHRVQERHDAKRQEAGVAPASSMLADMLHFAGEVEVIFGFWVIPLILALGFAKGWPVVSHYLNDTVNYTEPLFVVVIMALASTRPIVSLAEAGVRRIAAVGGGTPAAWWLSILMVGPLLGSFITEPAAMTISALLLSRRFFDRQPSTRLKYATLGLLFVNVSIGGTLTHFAAPPVLMVARPWGWDTAFMLSHFGWRAAVSIAVATVAYYFVFRKEFGALARAQTADGAPQDDTAGLPPVPTWITLIHLGAMAFTVVNAHYPALFVGGFLFFLGFTQATARYQARVELRAPLLVGFFLGGLVIHGGLQAWWIGPVLGSLSVTPLFAAAAILTSFNDNALITYLGTLVPNLSASMKVALVQGAVTGGGLTVIANAPNPAGQALLGRYFDNAVAPLYLAAGALFPTLVAVVLFRLF